MDVIDRYLSDAATAIGAISREHVRAAVDGLFGVWASGGTAWIIGNGGSASTASHMMNDLCKFTAVEGRKRFRAVALTDNVPLLSALANDVDYADVFSEPLMNFAQPGDALIAISGSGNSPNIVRATAFAKQLGVLVIGLCGIPGGKLRQFADVAVVVPATAIGQQEDGHLVVNHAIATALRERIAAAGSDLPAREAQT
jgi:D-sedoheptulose 7-phosphate isomerase